MKGIAVNNYSKSLSIASYWANRCDDRGLHSEHEYFLGDAALIELISAQLGIVRLPGNDWIERWMSGRRTRRAKVH